jgi:HEAT repeat protein
VLDEASDAEVQIAAVAALGSVGGSHVLGSVLSALRSDDWRVRSKAATSLGMIGDETASPLLVDALEDESWWVRRNSAAALAQIGGGVALLYGALTSDDMFARDAAAEALEDLGELARARHNHDEGLASEDEIRLLRHMSTARPISA